MKTWIQRGWALLWVLLLAACNLPELAAPTSGSVQPTPLIISLPQSGEAEGGVPTAPAAEDTVRAFLNAYQENPDQMKGYLSQNRVQKLTKGGALELLQFNGALEGFSIQAASVSPTTGVAQVEVEAKVGGAEVRRTFILVQEGGRWMIDAVRKPKKK